MTKFKRILLGSIGLCVFALLPLAQAQEPPGHNETAEKAHMEKRVQEIYAQLNLTDDQKKQLEMNKEQHRGRMENARKEVEASKQAIHAELMKPQLDMPKIYKIHNRIKSLQSQMEDDKLASILAVRAILTPEQFLKFANLMHKHKQ